MTPDSPISPAQNNAVAGGLPPQLRPAETSPVAANPPPDREASPVRHALALLLSLCLGLFLVEAIVSLLDESLLLLFDIQVLTMVRLPLFLCALLLAAVTYGLMGLTPMIPKRLFLPLTLFNFVAGLVAIPLTIFFYDRIHLVAWGISCGQVLLGLGILYAAQGGWKFGWPLVSERRLGGQRFSRRNLAVFLLVNVLGLGPAVIVYLGVCARLAVDHFSDGFLALRPAGLTVQARKYLGPGGKTVQLVPMLHVGEAAFYEELSRSFPTNAIILMEGVTDNQNLITNKINYQRMATSLGVAEQHEVFQPRGQLVSADVDVAQFSPGTLGFLNMVMLIHSQGVNAGTVLRMMQSSPPHFEEQLFEDLLRKRNQHLLQEIHARLQESETIIVPWGAAHMPEIAREIQKAGFRVDKTQEYVAIRFRAAETKSQRADQRAVSEKSK